MLQFFILGRESDLCLAELTQVLRAHNLPFEPVGGSKEFVAFEMPDVSVDLFHRCGGLIKFGEGKGFRISGLEQAVQELVRSRLPAEGRLTFGISVYSASQEVTRKRLAEVAEQMYLLGMTIKSTLKADGRSVRFVTGDEPALSSVTVDKNNLVSEKGLEILVGLGDKDVYVGATKAVQDYEAYADRDMNRPNRDDVAGMLPPKLARIMVNLAGLPIDKNTVVLDPFCGSGTVMQEALMLGAGKVLGSDVSAKAVADTQANLEWLMKHAVILGTTRVEQADASDANRWLPADFVDVMATEPFLGDPVRRSIRKEDAIKRQADLSKLYDAALESLSKVMKPNGRLVILFPVLDERRIPLPPAMGRFWRVLTPWSDVFENPSKRGGLDYQRPGQRVGRELFLLGKK